MRLAVVLEYLPVHTWREQWWGAALARGLSARGHEVTVLCDGVFDAGALGELRVEIRRPGRGTRRPQPVRFPRWVARRVRALQVDAVLSLTALVPSRFWLPIESAGAALRRSFEAGPLALALEVMEQPSLPVAAALEAFRRPRSHLALGPQIAGGVSLGFASSVEPPRDAGLVRLSARRALGIAPGQVAILLSATERRVEPVVPAICAMRGKERLVLLSVGPYAHALDEVVRREAPGLPVRHAGYVHDVAPVLLAADAVCVARPGGTGRLAAEAIVCGRPILVARQAPGSSLVSRASGSPGLVIPEVGEPTWEDAMSRANDPGWLEQVRPAVNGAADGLSMSRLLARLEHAFGWGTSDEHR